jgi:CheY-like chemotaxis protein
MMSEHGKDPNPGPGEELKSLRPPEEVTVLVVDDEPDVVVYLSSVLEDAGMNVLTAYDGDEALEILKENHVDLISLDLVMPRRSGIRLWTEIRKTKEWSRTPVIFVTGHAKDPGVKQDIAKAMEDSTMVGPSMYLEKPVTPKSYLNHICKVLGVTLPETAESPDDLRRRAMEMLENADTGTLEKVLDDLKRNKP